MRTNVGVHIVLYYRPHGSPTTRNHYGFGFNALIQDFNNPILAVNAIDRFANLRLGINTTQGSIADFSRWKPRLGGNS